MPPDENPNPETPQENLPANTSGEMSRDDLVNVMNYDPFANIPDNPQLPATTEEAETPAVEEPEPGTPARSEPSAPVNIPELTSLAESVNRLAERVNQPAPAAVTAKPDAAAGLQALEARLNSLYDFSLKPETIAALQSDNPAEVNQAISGCMTLVAKLVHRNVAKEVAAANAHLIGQIIPRMVSNEIELFATRQAINLDFYTHFPELSAPELGEVVRATSERLRKELKKTNWDADFRDRVGNAVMKALGIQRAEAAPTVPNAKPKAPNLLPGGSARPAGTMNGTGGPNSQADIMHTLYG